MISLLHDEVLIPQDSLRGGRLEALLKKCLAKEPQQRFASAAELRRELAHLIGGFGELSVAS
jgi:hypothetical protein